MQKIKKPSKQYILQRIYKDTNKKLQKLSVKKGQYIIEIVARLVDKEYESMV